LVFTKYSTYFSPNIGHFCRKPNTQSVGQKKSFSVGLYPKNMGTSKNKGFLGNSVACQSENRLQIVTQTDQNQDIFFLLTSEKYLAVFTEYLVAEYSADHHLAEYSADRIVGRS
jgi:hypothetical protein